MVSVTFWNTALTFHDYLEKGLKWDRLEMHGAIHVGDTSGEQRTLSLWSHGMSQRELEHRDSFIAIDEQGYEHLLHVWRWVQYSPGPRGTMKQEGLSLLKTSDNVMVTRIEKGIYVVTRGRESLRLTSDDPKAM